MEKEKKVNAEEILIDLLQSNLALNRVILKLLGKSDSLAPEFPPPPPPPEK